MNQKLHIVCFDVPYPADHGGMFDLFYKIVALHRLGVHISLHCFEYGKGQQEELKKYCLEIYYYKRKTGIKGLSPRLPYIVSSRKNKLLIKNLSADNTPILLEGTHCTYILYKNLFPQRTILYRLHNIEQVYYQHLFRNEKAFYFKKIYYWFEGLLLKNYEKQVLKNATSVLPVSQKDAEEIKKTLPNVSLRYTPVFLPFQKLNILKETGNYCLYHGNLSIAENEQAAIWLAENLMEAALPLLIAGRNPSHKLISILSQKNIRLISNPSDDEVMHLIQNAQINIILSFNRTGIKLKLLNALFYGRHCIANDAAIPGPAFKFLCNIADTSKKMKQLISDLKNQPISEVEILKREEFLLGHFDNKRNAQKLSELW